MNLQKSAIAIFFLMVPALICSITSCGGSSPALASPASSLVASPTVAVTVIVTPSTATVFTSLTAQFTATVSGASNPAVTWSVNGIAGGNQTFGTISDSGLYTAPALVPNPPSFPITANPVANSASSATSQVTIVTPIRIVLSPETLTLLPGQTQYFTASVTGAVNSGLTWTVNGVAGGNAAVGTLTTTRVDGTVFFGQYTAPTVPPLSEPLTIQAISTVDPAAFAISDVTIQPDNQLPQSGPIKLGTSGGNASDILMNGGSIGGCCSGTLGSLLSRGGNFYILSNNHVLAKADQGSAGDPIVQPGLGDVNCQVQSTATVAHLSQAPALHVPSSNVDAAIAAIVPGAVDTSGTILDLAGPNQPAPPSVTLADAQTVFSSNEPIAKVGRSSSLTCSTIASIAADITVNYQTSCGSDESFQVSYTNQIIVVGESFSEPGDSGSLVVTADTARPVGLLFAGNGSATSVNPIQDVLSALKDPSSGEVPIIVGSADHGVGCPSSAQDLVVNSSSVVRAQPDAQAMQQAQIAKMQYESQFLRNPAVVSVSIGSSDDDPQQPAILVHVRDSLQTPIPHQVGGVRTKIVFDQGSPEIPLSNAAITAALRVKDHHSAELLSNPKVFGVGVAASKDSPGQAAIVIYLDRASTMSIPAEIDGTRTQIVRTDPFRTSGWGKEVPRACSGLRNSGSASHATPTRLVPESIGFWRW